MSFVPLHEIENQLPVEPPRLEKFSLRTRRTLTLLSLVASVCVLASVLVYNSGSKVPSVPHKASSTYPHVYYGTAGTGSSSSVVVLTTLSPGLYEISIRGPYELDCSNQVHTTSSDGNINLEKSDCLVTALGNYGIKLVSATWVIDRIIVQFSGHPTLTSVDLVPQANFPQVHYTETDTFSVSLISRSNTTYDISINGEYHVYCSNQDYTLTNGIINLETSTRCLKESLATQGIALGTATFSRNAFGSTITTQIDGHNSITALTLSLVSYPKVFFGSDSANTFSATLIAYSRVVYDIAINGVYNVDCSNQLYSLGADGTINLEEATTTCLKSGLAQYGLTITSSAFDSSNSKVIVTFSESNSVMKSITLQRV